MSSAIVPRDVRIVRTGRANIASVLAGFGRLGLTPLLVETAAEAEAAEYLVLPGVGAFGATMAHLRNLDLVEPLCARIAAGRPTLAVCLGLQLLCRESEESPGSDGLGIVPARITRFADPLRVPQLGWNLVTSEGVSPLLASGHAYFANSYKLDAPPVGWSVATADYGGRFVAALARGPVLACQFHPELSGPWGLSWLRRWLGYSPEPEGNAC